LAVKQAAQGRARPEAGRTVIKAPFACRLGDVEIHRDQFLASGQTLFEAHGTESAEIDAQVPLDQLRTLIDPAHGVQVPVVMNSQTIERLFKFQPHVRYRSGVFLNIPLSMPSILGFVSLTGIVVNDSLLLVLFLKMERQQGGDALAAAALAGRQRFRAIILTSLTAIAGLLPLLAKRSLQAQVLIPLATSIAFGLMAWTVLVLLFVPCLYAILNDLGWTSNKNQEREETG
jgi:hypothetical protein